MNGNSLPRLLAQAVAQGLLPAGAAVPQEDSRPWPVLMLTALGAWLAAVPLIAVVGMLLGDIATSGAGPYAVGALLLAGAVVVLRGQGVPLFVEQLALPALIVAGGTLAFGLFRDLASQTASAVLAAVALGVAVAVPRPWLRALLGAAAAVLLGGACLSPHWMSWERAGRNMFWLGWHIDLAAWLAALATQRLWETGAHARKAAVVESIAAGWLLATLAGLAWWSGMTFLAGASATGLMGDVARELGQPGQSRAGFNAMQGVSTLLAAGAAAVLWRAWPTTRRSSWAAVAAVLLALAWFMPSLGAVLLGLAVCATSGRARLAGAAAVAAAWIVGSFYYALAWPLSDKAVLLAAAGALLGTLAWHAWPRAEPQVSSAATTPRPAGRLAAAAVMLTAAGTLLVVNLGIREKEALIAHGQPVFVELAPVDPRSLMQGDYMRLNFRLPADTARASLANGSERPRVVAALDARGIATLLRVDVGAPLEDRHARIELTPKNGGWILVTDAWHFTEGEAGRWSRARYGEFRVDQRGRALLVGLRGPQLEAL